MPNPNINTKNNPTNSFLINSFPKKFKLRTVEKKTTKFTRVFHYKKEGNSYKIERYKYALLKSFNSDYCAGNTCLKLDVLLYYKQKCTPISPHKIQGCVGYDTN